MTCRHQPGDPTCSSYPRWKEAQDAAAELERLADLGRRFEAREAELLARTPNPDDYDIVEIEEVDANLVVMVQYSKCEKCSFDSKKVMVFLDQTMKDAVRWHRIDPHFREDLEPRGIREAPPPRARFPGDPKGWDDAVEYAGAKVR